MISRRHFLQLVSGGAGAAAVCASDAFAIEPRFGLIVKHWQVRHEHWKNAARPLRIAILTDIHAVEPWMSADRIRAIVARLNSLKPDIAVLLGDYVNALGAYYRTALVPVPDWTGALEQIKAPFGVYAVLGNHDWWSKELGLIRHAFKKSNIQLLENAATKVAFGESPFWIGGLGDQLAYGSRGVDDLPGTLSQIPGGPPIILLAHEPDIFWKVPPRVTLTLAGHTHGGQVYIPFIGRPAVYSYRNLAYGHVHLGGKHLIVSSGVGVSHLPVRFLVPPEITLVTLSSKQTEATSQSQSSVNLASAN